MAASWISLTRVAKAWAMAGIWALMPLTKTLILDSIMSLFEGSLIIRPSTKYDRTIAEIAPWASFFKQTMWTTRSIRRSMLSKVAALSGSLSVLWRPGGTSEVEGIQCNLASGGR